MARSVFGCEVQGAVYRFVDGAETERSVARCDLVIGKFSVVAHQSKAIGESLKPVASLTDAEGQTTQRGMFAVRSDCQAATLLDLDGAIFYLGNEDCDENGQRPNND